MAAAWSMSRFPERFEVQVWEKAVVPGGVATSESLPVLGAEGGAASWINDGVQGGAPSYHNTLLFHREFGFEPQPVNLRVSFGRDGTAWNNVCETPIIRQHRASIARFGRLLKWVSKLEFLFVFLPISLVLRLFFFPRDFAAHLVYPLTALFFGTGNQTPNVSSAVIARVFLDPDARLFDYDPDRLLSQTPAMFAFRSLNTIYTTIASRLGPSVTMCYQRAVARATRTARGVELTDERGAVETFDEVVFATDAETALRALAGPTRWEKWTLGNVQYFNDVSVTHTDAAYMHAHYDVDDQRGDQYYVRTDTHNPDLIEMSFNLRNYQPQLKQDVFQSIFLDDNQRHTWTKDKIDPKSIVLTKWWRQFSHTWRHFAFTVPFVRFIQGTQHTWYCGGYTVFNTHEMAVTSGLAVAARLGAPYPFAADPLAAKQFDLLLRLSHGVSRASLAP